MPRGSRTGSLDASAISSLCATLGAQVRDAGPFVGSADVSPVDGFIVIASSGVDAMTLVAPIAGDFREGGQDGNTLFYIDTTGHAHTVTSTGNLVTNSANVNTATFSGTKGASLELRAYGGKWYVVASLGITFS
jgi:hypothetical protein